jgi:hypothetical protein
MLLHVDIPTPADLEALAAARHPASVSIFLPTTPVAGEISGDRIELKNLAGEARAQLEAAGHDKREVAALDEALADLVEDDGFWRFQATSLAIYATPHSLRSFRVPNRLTAELQVADRFHLKPLLRAVTFGHAAYVLALAEGHVRLLQLTADQPAIDVKVADLPKSATEALGVSSMGVRTESRRTDTSSGQRGRLAQFCRAVDRALRPYLAGKHVPLFLAADSALGAIYRSVNSYPHLAGFGIDTTPEAMNDGDISESARRLLDRLHAEEVAGINALFAERAGSGRATADIAQAARAATEGAVQTLLVDIDRTVPGLVDEASGAVSFAEVDDAVAYGIVDEIARRSLQTGARVLAVRGADLPTESPVAAILRWAA